MWEKARDRGRLSDFDDAWGLWNLSEWLGMQVIKNFKPTGLNVK